MPSSKSLAPCSLSLFQMESARGLLSTADARSWALPRSWHQTALHLQSSLQLWHTQEGKAQTSQQCLLLNAAYDSLGNTLKINIATALGSIQARGSNRYVNAKLTSTSGDPHKAKGCLHRVKAYKAIRLFKQYLTWDQIFLDSNLKERLSEDSTTRLHAWSYIMISGLVTKHKASNCCKK